MVLTKNEATALGIFNLGVALLTGIWLGFAASLISFVVVYVMIGLRVNEDYGETPIWNWFFHTLEISLPTKSK